jgi:type IV secretion system protein VirB8
MFSKKRPTAVDTQPQARALTNLDWEVDILTNERQSKRLAWRMFVLVSCVCAAQAAALTMLVPLHRVVPFVVEHDRTTGETKVVSTDDTVQNSPMLDKHWIKTFVVARERYSYPIVQQDYLTVRRLAGNGPWSTYQKLFDDDTSLDRVYGEHIEVIPRILSVTINGDGLATVRFELTKTDKRLTTPPEVTRKVATLRYAYGKRIMQEAEAIENPLGFSVPGYQTDPELVDATGGAK